MSELKVQNLRRTFGSVVALEDISFDVAEGEFFCLLGASSFGKTTILRSIAGLEELAGGAVHFGGQVDFAAIFSNIAANNFVGWAVVEWYWALKLFLILISEPTRPYENSHAVFCLTIKNIK